MNKTLESIITTGSAGYNYVPTQTQLARTTPPNYQKLEEKNKTHHKQ